MGSCKFYEVNITLFIIIAHLFRNLSIAVHMDTTFLWANVDFSLHTLKMLLHNVH